VDDLIVGNLTIPAAELDERFETSGGPGGQHANRNETTVRLRFDVGASSIPNEAKSKILSRLGPTIEVTAGDHRSQWRNRALARRRLVEVLQGALAEQTKRRPTKPTRASKNRRLSSKRAQSDKKRDRRPPRPED
jgi:ribosome-associated protein